MRVSQSAFSAGNPNDLLTVFQNFDFLFSGFFIAGDGAQRDFNNDVFSIATMTIIRAASFSVFGQYILVIAKME